MPINQEQKEYINERVDYTVTKSVAKIKNWVIGIFLVLIGGAGAVIKNNERTSTLMEVQSEQLTKFMDAQTEVNKTLTKNISYNKTKTTNYANEIKSDLKIIAIEVERQSPTFKASLLTRGSKTENEL